MAGADHKPLRTTWNVQVVAVHGTSAVTWVKPRTGPPHAKWGTSWEGLTSPHLPNIAPNHPRQGEGPRPYRGGTLARSTGHRFDGTWATSDADPSSLPPPDGQSASAWTTLTTSPPDTSLATTL